MACITSLVMDFSGIHLKYELSHRSLWLICMGFCPQSNEGEISIAFDLDTGESFQSCQAVSQAPQGDMPESWGGGLWCQDRALPSR